MQGMKWPKKAIDWIEGDTAYVSVPFTWELPGAYPRCAFLAAQGYKVRAGGPAVNLMPDYLADVAKIGGSVDALRHHNPNATLTSRGCIRNCGFCAVPKIEGNLVELDTWESKPIVCDNNLLACSRAHFDKVIDSLIGVPEIDFNQGLDARLLTKYHVDRLRELDCAVVRLAWDHTSEEALVIAALDKLSAAGFPKYKIRVFILVGFDDTPEDALYRLETIKSMRILPNPQRFNPLDTLQRNSYVGSNWTDKELRRYMRYWSRQIWFSKIPFDEFRG